jgi:hypothetical protein
VAIRLMTYVRTAPWVSGLDVTIALTDRRTFSVHRLRRVGGPQIQRCTREEVARLKICDTY